MAAPSTYFKVAGDWKRFTAMHFKVAGVWKAIHRAYVKVGGQWKLVFEGVALVRGNPTTLGAFDGSVNAAVNADGEGIVKHSNGDLTWFQVDPYAVINTEAGANVAQLYAGTVTRHVLVLTDIVEILDPSGVSVEEQASAAVLSTPFLGADGVVYYIRDPDTGTGGDYDVCKLADDATAVLTTIDYEPGPMCEDGNGTLYIFDANTNFVRTYNQTTGAAGATFDQTRAIFGMAIGDDGSIWSGDFGAVYRNTVEVAGPTMGLSLARDWRTGHILIAHGADGVYDVESDGSNLRLIVVPDVYADQLRTTGYDPDSVLVFDGIGLDTFSLASLGYEA